VTTASLVTPQSYYGLDFKYTPIYGKMAFGNKTLTPFDMYFSGGLGQTSYNNGSAPTLHLGTGQIFAMSKAFALRWDFSWNFFQATTYINSTQTVGSSAIFNNLFVLLGASWFFPEATYR
jgi:outer membrane beta-barrel protein